MDGPERSTIRSTAQRSSTSICGQAGRRNQDVPEGENDQRNENPPPTLHLLLSAISVLAPGRPNAEKRRDLPAASTRRHRKVEKQPIARSWQSAIGPSATVNSPRQAEARLRPTPGSRDCLAPSGNLYGMPDLFTRPPVLSRRPALPPRACELGRAESSRRASSNPRSFAPRLVPKPACPGSCPSAAGT